MNPRCVEYEKMTEPNMTQGCIQEPMYECPQERVCTRVIMHEVPHIIPIHTKIINHHVYRHTYTPCFTMSECDTCENVYDQCGMQNF